MNEEKTNIETNTDEASHEEMPFLTRVVALFLRGDVAIMFVVISLILGAAALYLTPREEEPQIVVPMADIFVKASGLSSTEIEQQVTRRLEKLLYQIDGVEYVYSMSRPGECVVTVRFYVGNDREDSLVKLYNKVHSNIDLIPPVVDSWVIKPVEIDDVPIVIATIWTDRTNQVSDHELRRIAEQAQNELQSIPDTNRVHVTGGRPRIIRVELDPQRLAAREISLLQISKALNAGNVNIRSGEFEQQNQQFILETGQFIQSIEELENFVVSVIDNRPVYLKDVAKVIDGPDEVENYSWIGFGPAEKNIESGSEVYPAVHLSVGKKKGSNAVWVANAVEEKLEELKKIQFPSHVEYRITRNYGETANEKVNELVESLVVAVITVVGLIGLIIGWRAAFVVALAIPVCYSLTLFINMLAGYTINRVTMFALILSLGLLVDDPITDVENIARYFSLRRFSSRLSVLKAIQEVRPALVLSTIAIIASFLPLFFITGMMGPYMAPMAMNVPLTVTLSTVVAFILTPWLAMVALRHMIENPNDEEAFDITKRPLYRATQKILGPVIDHKILSWLALGGTGLLLLLAMLLPVQRLIPLKMLPYDNKNEFQVIVDMPESSTLEKTDAVARKVGQYLSTVSEVLDYEIFSGNASPMDFNGMVRHYFLRKGSNVADIRVNLVHKDFRVQQSHEIILRIRNDIDQIAKDSEANIKLVEMPPGPPVLATITAEVYGPNEMPYDQLISSAHLVEKRLKEEPGLVDVDISSEDKKVKWEFQTDKPKAALSGISTQNIAETLKIALEGENATVFHLPDEVDPLWIKLRLPRKSRSAINELKELYIIGDKGQVVQLGGIGKFVQTEEDQPIYHKNLKRVVFVYAEIAGRPPADAIMDIQFDRVAENTVIPEENQIHPVEERSWLSPGGNQLWKVPEGVRVEWAGEGEWKITLDVFRDLGLAFGAALIGIFIVLMFQTNSRVLPLLIMLAIPLTMIGIMPGFWLLNAFFTTPVDGFANPVFITATAMIGMIALAGIVVRNSVVLIDFIHIAQNEGLDLRESIIRSVAVRTRPILLTAGTTLLANWVITLDPVFSGLAWSIIFGIITSTLFTLIIIPTTYWLLYKNEQKQSA